MTAAGNWPARKPLFRPACLLEIKCGCERSCFLCGYPPSVSWTGLNPEGVGTVVEVGLVVSVEINLRDHVSLEVWCARKPEMNVIADAFNRWRMTAPIRLRRCDPGVTIAAQREHCTCEHQFDLLRCGRSLRFRDSRSVKVGVRSTVSSC